MPPETPPQPWRAFLDELDALLPGPARLHCKGGFAIVHAYGLARATADIDVLDVAANVALALTELAGRDSALARRHGVHLDFVGVATVPEDYESRMLALYPSTWTRLELFVLEAHDLALSKLERNFERDRTDVLYLARQGLLNPSTLRRRYWSELRPHMLSRQSWHDQTLEMWMEALFHAS